MTDLPDRVGIVGAGVMGRDISAVFAATGHDVTLVDVDPDALEAARDYHERTALPILERAGYTPSAPIARRIEYGSSIADVADAGFVLETVTESLSTKRSVVAEVATETPSAVPIGTNTSSLTANEIGARIENPGRVLLFHFAKPAIERDLVELAGEHVPDATLNLAGELARLIGKEPVELARERRGNGLSRLSAAIKAAATWQLERTTPGAIDRAAAAVGFERGPIELIDAIGLDVHLATVSNLQTAYGGRFDPPASVRTEIEAMVDRGHLGQKSGKGFFEWTDDRAHVPEGDADTEHIEPVLSALVNEAHRMVADGIAPAETIDRLFRLGSGGPVGPFDLEDLLGREYIRELLESRYRETGSPLFQPADRL
ncbi:MAG: 3-hydroxyacyl-CoA dehydrogenase NAD-binding domain-containing protein [Halodesulfurarchaeum sp.]